MLQICHAEAVQVPDKTVHVHRTLIICVKLESNTRPHFDTTFQYVITVIKQWRELCRLLNIFVQTCVSCVTVDTHLWDTAPGCSLRIKVYFGPGFCLAQYHEMFNCDPRICIVFKRLNASTLALIIQTWNVVLRDAFRKRISTCRMVAVRFLTREKFFLRHNASVLPQCARNIVNGVRGSEREADHLNLASRLRIRGVSTPLPCMSSWYDS
jgi:hypothetical protein